MRDYIIGVILDRFLSSDAGRREALHDVIKLSAPGIETQELDSLIEQVPALPQVIRQKWAGMFADRLLETVESTILADLCADDEKNRSTLALIFIMFLESERMEKVIEEDLSAYRQEQ